MDAHGVTPDAALTYPERGATRGFLPPGYRHVDRRDHIGTGAAVFREAVAALHDWRMHRGAGLRVVSAPPAAEPDAVVVMRLGPITIPCRVVYLVDEPDRRGFAYGTLPGHPVRGEELFLLERNPDGEVDLVIRAFSRPASALARAGGPLTRAAQSLVTDRYVRALRRVSRRPG